MPVYDIECERCHKIIEVIESVKTNKVRRCPKCGGITKRIISARRSTDNLVDPAWLKSVTDIVAKGADATMADTIFLRNPTRRNYKAWMRSRGLRPLEPGEGPSRPEPPDMDKIVKEMWDKDVQRRAISVRGHGRFGEVRK